MISTWHVIKRAAAAPERTEEGKEEEAFRKYEGAGGGEREGEAEVVQFQLQGIWEERLREEKYFQDSREL